MQTTQERPKNEEMMLTTPALLALSLIAQASHSQPPKVRTPVAQAPKFRLNETVSVVEATFAGGTEQALLSWTTLMLHREPEWVKATTTAAKQAIVKQVCDEVRAKGHTLIAFDPTDILRVLEIGVAPPDEAGLPKIMYRLQVVQSDDPALDDQVSFLFEFQLKKTTEPVSDNRDLIYKEARSALIEVKNRAAGKSLSIRKSFLARESSEALEEVAKKHRLALTDLNKIIAEGQEKDGTAERRRRANNPAKMAARQQNAMMLGIIGAQLDAMTSQVVSRYNAEQSAKAAAFARSIQPPNPNAPLGGMVGGGVKDVFVHDYYRADGTHVNSYFRSRPSR